MNKIQQESICKKVTRCRACWGTKFKPWINLGLQPLANNLVSNFDIPEPIFPLSYMYCTNCELVQTTHVVHPDLLFKSYLYYSSTSQVFIDHFKTFAEEQFNRGTLKKNDLVVDIGSNDGILLKPMQKLGARVVGVEPCSEIAANAIAVNKVETIAEYFTVKLAGKINELYGEAKIVTMTNAFAHIDDLDEVLRGVKFLLDPDGTFVIEVAYLQDMLAKGTFDLLYHEHLCAWHLYPMGVLLKRHGMYIDDVDFIPVHGGSIRVYAKFIRGQQVKVNDTRGRYLTRSKLFKQFPMKVRTQKEESMKLLEKIKKDGKRIIGYGAPAKMSTITNFYGITSDMIDYIIDDSEPKQGLYSPFQHIKIVKPFDTLDHCTHEYIFIFAWNFADSIMKKLKDKGYKGKFIIPFPKLKIV